MRLAVEERRKTLSYSNLLLEWYLSCHSTNGEEDTSGVNLLLGITL